MKEKIIDISITIGLLEAEIDSLKDAYKNCKFSALKREYSTQLVSHKQALKMLKQAADHEPLINQEVEKRIKERERLAYLIGITTFTQWADYVPNGDEICDKYQEEIDDIRSRTSQKQGDKE